MTREERDEARRLYETEEGWTYEKLAERYGSSKTRIGEIAQEEGWSKHDRSEMVRKITEKTAEIRVEEIAALNAEMLDTARKAMSIVRKQVEALDKRVRESEAQGEAKFPPHSVMRGVVQNYEKLANTIRLQTGQTTGKNDITVKDIPVALVEFVDSTGKK